MRDASLDVRFSIVVFDIHVHDGPALPPGSTVNHLPWRDGDVSPSRSTTTTTRRWIIFFPITPRVIGVDPVSRVPRLASRVSTEKPLRSRRLRNARPRDRSARLHARPRASARPIARADRSRIFFFARSARRTLTSAAGIARARRSSESLGENGCRRASRNGANARHSCACARVRESLSPRERERERGEYYHRSFHREFAARRARATTR